MGSRPHTPTQFFGSTPPGPEATLEKHGGLSFLTNCNYDDRLQVGNLLPFYLDVLKQWQITIDCMRSETVCVHEEIIWNNQKILLNGKPLFYKSWFEKNIIRVSDLLQKDGKFLSFKNFCNKYKLKIPFTVYFGLNNTIPTSWKVAAKKSPRDFQKVRKQKKSFPQKMCIKFC